MPERALTAELAPERVRQKRLPRRKFSRNEFESKIHFFLVFEGCPFCVFVLHRQHGGDFPIVGVRKERSASLFRVGAGFGFGGGVVEDCALDEKGRREKGFADCFEMPCGGRRNCRLCSPFVRFSQDSCGGCGSFDSHSFQIGV